MAYSELISKGFMKCEQLFRIIASSYEQLVVTSNGKQGSRSAVTWRTKLPEDWLARFIPQFIHLCIAMMMQQRQFH